MQLPQKIKIIIHLCLICAFCLVSSAVFGAGPIVVVNSFSVYGDESLKEIVPGLESALASRLAGSGYSVVMRSESEETKEDFSVDAAITYLSGAYSMDLTIKPSNDRIFEKTSSKDQLFDALERLAEKAKASLENSISKTNGTVGGSVAASDQTLGQELKAAFESHRMGPSVEGEARSMVAADADGDGANEILLLIDGEILAFRDNGKEILQVWNSPAPDSFTPVCLSAGDIDGNGVDELFFAGSNNTGVVSQAFEWFGSMLAPKGQIINGFVRTAAHPDRGTMLLGMTSGFDDQVFSYGIKVYSWSGSQYQSDENLESTPKSILAANMDWAKLNDSDPPYAIATNQNDKLEIYDDKWDEVFQSADDVKGARTLLEKGESFVRIQGRTLWWKSPGEQHLLLTFKNNSSLSRIFTRSTSYSHGQIIALRWDGLALMTVAEGPKMRGFITDVATAPLASDHSIILYVAFVESEGTLFKKETTKIIAYELPSIIQEQ